MSLEIDLVAGVVVALAVEKMVEGDFVERGGGGERRNVPADARMFLIRSHDHRHRIPADDALDAAFDFSVAGIDRLLIGGNAIDIRRHGGKRYFDAGPMGFFLQDGEQIADALRPLAFQNVSERFEPFLGFARVFVLGDRSRGTDRFFGRCSFFGSALLAGRVFRIAAVKFAITLGYRTGIRGFYRSRFFTGAIGVRIAIALMNLGPADLSSCHTLTSLLGSSLCD